MDLDKFDYLFLCQENLQGENPGCSNRFSSYLLSLINQEIKKKPSLISRVHIRESDLRENLETFPETCHISHYYNLQLEQYKNYLSLFYKLLLTKILNKSESIISTIIDRIMNQSLYFKNYDYNFENYLFYNNHPVLYLELPKIYSCICFNSKENKIKFSYKPFHRHPKNCLSEYIIFRIEVLFNYYKNKPSFECKTICKRELTKMNKL